MDIDINLVLDELVTELADKIRQIAILRAQIKTMQAAEAPSPDSTVQT
jgi:hypothetical protein